VYDGINSHLWTLAVEEQFYLFWPIVVLVIPKQGLLKTIILMIAIGPFSRIVGMEWFDLLDKPHEMVHVLTPTTLDCFGIGALLAYFETFRFDSYLKFARSKGPLLIGITGIVFYMLLRQYRTGVWDDVFLRTAISMFGVYLISWNYRINIDVLSKSMLFKAFIHVGKISYGIYLFHPYVKAFFDWFRVVLIDYLSNERLIEIINISFGNKIQFVLLTILTITLSSFSWWLIESPINKLKSKFPYS